MKGWRKSHWLLETGKFVWRIQKIYIPQYNHFALDRFKFVQSAQLDIICPYTLRKLLCKKRIFNSGVFQNRSDPPSPKYFWNCWCPFFKLKLLQMRHIWFVWFHLMFRRIVPNTDIDFVKKFTQARFLKTNFYPKVHKSRWTQDCDKTA